MKKGILLILIGLSSLVFLITSVKHQEIKSTPDSGWDYDYDYDNDYDYDYDYDNDYDYGYSYDRSSGSGKREYKKCEGDWWNDCGGKIAVIGFSVAISIPILYYLLQDKIKEKNRMIKKRIHNLLFRKFEVKRELKNYQIYKKKDLDEYGLDYDYIINKAYQIYEDVQVAWMNFDYDILRDNLSDELFNIYRIQLESLALKNKKNIMKDFKKKGIYIIGIKEEKGVYTIDVALDVFQKDYVVNIDKPRKAIRGNKYKHGVLYKITYTMTKKKHKNCPNCGAKLNNKASEICKSCGAVVTSNNHDLVMIQKKVIMQ